MDFEFNIVSVDEFICTFTVSAEMALVKKIFNEATKRYGGKADEEMLQTEFVLPEKYYKLLQVGLKKNIKSVADQVNEDGIQILRSEVVKAVYKSVRERQEWDVFITIKGLYKDNR